MLPPSRRHSAALLLERVIQISARCLQRRDESENETRGKRYQQRKHQHASIEVDLLQTRQVDGLQAQQELQPQRAYDHTAEPTEESEQQALG